MALKQPESMDELVYFTDRDIGSGSARVWVFRQKCPKCGKTIMSKPVGEKGKVKIRASEYVCPSCGHRVEKDEYENTLTANTEYKCPKCLSSGEAQIPFKRKNIEGVLTLRVNCSKCGTPIDVTKKMKEPKKKKEKKGSLSDII